MSIDVVAGGALMGNSIEVAKALLEEMPPITTTGPVSELHQRGPVESMELMLWSCLQVRLMPLHRGLIGLGLLQGAKWGALQVLCLRLGNYVRCVAFKTMWLLNAILFTRELSMPMPCKTSILSHKIANAQTHTTLAGETTLTSPTETTTPFLLIPLDLSLLAFNRGCHIIHLLNNSLLNPGLI